MKGSNMSYVRTWYEETQEYKGMIDKLIADIGWVDGFNEEGQILYHYSKEECRKIILRFLNSTPSF